MNNIKVIESYLKQKNAYIIASVDGVDCRTGSFQGIGQDDEGNLIIETIIGNTSKSIVNKISEGSQQKEELQKYELTGETTICNGITFHRIKAIKNFSTIKAGTLGGWIEKEENLSHDENAWVYENAKIHGDTKLTDNAKVYTGENMTINGVGECFLFTGEQIVCSGANGSILLYQVIATKDFDEIKRGECGVWFQNPPLESATVIFGNTQILNAVQVFNDNKCLSKVNIYNNANSGMYISDYTNPESTNKYTSPLTGRELACHILSSEFKITDEVTTEAILDLLTETLLSDESLMRPAIKAALNTMGITSPV